MDELFLIWSVEHGAWWRPKRAGYCASYDVAGRYSRDEAYTISARANWRCLNEVPVPAAFFDFQKRLQAELEKVTP